MRLVNIKERMPTVEDADTSREVAWVAITRIRNLNNPSEVNRYTESASLVYDESGLQEFQDRIRYDPGLDEIFWLEVHSQPVQQEIKSHIRRVEL